MNMFDIGSIQSVITVVSFVVFVGIVVWAWSGRRTRDFGEAARIPLDDDRPRSAAAQPATGKEER
jgi:cytochrome c oxidase cbb3-type subunit 4